MLDTTEQYNEALDKAKRIAEWNRTLSVGALGHSPQMLITALARALLRENAGFHAYHDKPSKGSSA